MPSKLKQLRKDLENASKEDRIQAMIDENRDALDPFLPPSDKSEKKVPKKPLAANSRQDVQNLTKALQKGRGPDKKTRKKRGSDLKDVELLSDFSSTVRIRRSGRYADVEGATKADFEARDFYGLREILQRDFQVGPGAS